MTEAAGLESLESGKHNAILMFFRGYQFCSVLKYALAQYSPRLILASYGYSDGKVRHPLALFEFHVSDVMLEEGNNIRRLCQK